MVLNKLQRADVRSFFLGSRVEELYLIPKKKESTQNNMNKIGASNDSHMHEEKTV